MVPKSGCLSCRERHIKCVLDKVIASPSGSGSRSCTACAKASRECIQESFYRFKLVKSVSQRLGGDSSTFQLSYDSKQKWVKIPPELVFVSDSGDPLEEILSPSDSCLEVLEEAPECEARCAMKDGTDCPAAELEPENGSDPEPIASALLPEPPISMPQHDLEHTDIQSFDVTQTARPSEYRDSFRFSNGSPSLSLPILSPLASSAVFDSPGSYSYVPPLPALHRTGSSSSVRRSELPFTDREAYLVRHYIEKLSPWADACDPYHHFATVVPQRAVDSPLLMYALLAFSAEVNGLSLLKDENHEASEYYNKSVRILIDVLSDPLAYDENVLAAVVLLRMYEERSINDDRCHLLGQQRLISSMAEFLHVGGLGEAAAWVSLRQDIYVSIVSKQPISIDLKVYEKSHAFEKRDDGAWTNVMVYIFARVLALVFSPSHQQSTAEWQELEMKIDEWYITKPKSFDPISFYRPATCKDRSYREIWMLNSFHVVGIQYYYLAKIFLKAYKPSVSVFGFGAVRERRDVEGAIAEYLGIIIGLSFGNPLVQNVWFTTSHILSACGCYLRDARERRAAVEFLEMMESRTNWRTSQIVSALQQEWNCLDKET